MSKDKKEKHHCPHGLNLTDEEDKAVVWLQHYLAEEARECSPTSRLSSVAHRAVGKLFKKLNELHTELHAAEDDLEQAEMLVSGMVGVPHALGLVKDEDLN